MTKYTSSARYFLMGFLLGCNPILKVKAFKTATSVRPNSIHFLDADGEVSRVGSTPKNFPAQCS